MAEPDNIVLEQLPAIRVQLEDIERKVEGLDRKVDSKADTANIADVALKLDGLTHMVASSFGAIIHRLDSIDKRVSLLERQEA